MTIEINDKGYTELYRLKKEIQFYYFNLIVST